MGEPEVEPGAQSGTLASQCENSEIAEEALGDTDKPLSPNSTNELAVSETDLTNKETVSMAGELTAIAEKEEACVSAGDDNPFVKEEEAEVDEGPTVEVERSSVQSSPLEETKPVPEAVITGTEEALKEEGSEINHAVQKEGGDDQLEVSVKEEVGHVANIGSLSEEGAVGEVVAGCDDTVPKEEGGVEQEVEPMDETERKDKDIIQTDEEAPQEDREMVHSEANNQEVDELQPEDANPTQDEETNMDESMHDDPDADKLGDDDLTQEGHGNKAMNEDLSEEEDSDKVMDEDLTEDGDGDNAVNEPSASVDGDGMDDNAVDDQVAGHGEEMMGTNDAEEDEDEDDPPPLPAKKSSNARKKRGRPTRIKKGEEELCFICFDGGELVVCDRRSDY